MVRLPLTLQERARGARLGSMLRAARGDRSIVDVAAGAGVSAETLRKIESGRIAAELGLTLDDVTRQCASDRGLGGARAG